MRKFLRLLSDLMRVVGPRRFPGQAIGPGRNAAGRQG